MEILFILMIVVSGIVGFGVWRRAVRRKRLMEKYGDAALVEKLMSGMFWEGMPAEQLVDSLGSPIEVDNKVMKSRRREIWKYNQVSKRRFALRITLDNDMVVGWDKKA